MEVSISEFARRSEVSRKSVNEAIKHGKIFKTQSGKIETTDPRVTAYVQTALLNKSQQPTKRSTNPTRGESQAKVLNGDHAPGLTIHAENHAAPVSNYAVQPSGFGELTEKSKADLEKVRATTVKIQLEIAQKMGTLILRSEVQKAFGSMSSVIVNHFLPMGDRLTEAVCAKLEVSDAEIKSEVQLVIEKEVMRALEEFKRESKEKFKNMEKAG